MRETRSAASLGKIEIKHLVLVVSIACIFVLTGCSRLTLFVVINKSDRAIDVRYRIRESPGDILLVCGRPGIKPASQLGNQQSWQELSDSQYKLERDTRFITVSLRPQEALRITVTGYAGNEEDELRQAERFCVEEIGVTGANGVINLQGRQSYRGFKTEDEIRSLTYY